MTAVFLTDELVIVDALVAGGLDGPRVNEVGIILGGIGVAAVAVGDDRLVLEILGQLCSILGALSHG